MHCVAAAFCEIRAREKHLGDCSVVLTHGALVKRHEMALANGGSAWRATTDSGR